MCIRDRSLQQTNIILKKIIVAIDGHSSCGKSTLANDISHASGYLYISTGSMYRAVTLYFLRQDIDIKNESAVEKALQEIDIDLRVVDGQTFTFLNGENVETEIRDMPVSNLVSPVSAIPAVRTAMVAQQRKIGENKGVVMDGRDIGTVVFTDAELKIFLTSDPNIRAIRRYKELQQKGIIAALQDVEANLTQRDHLDSTRTNSPLAKASDAVLIDNTNITREEQLAMVLALMDARIKAGS